MANILIVEDEGVVGMNVEVFINSMGHNVVDVVNDGQKALEVIEARKPDLVIMDIVLHGNMSGIETTRKINSLYNIPVLYMTAYSDEASMKAANATRHAGILLKPFPIEKLKDCIEKALAA